MTGRRTKHADLLATRAAKAEVALQIVSSQSRAVGLLPAERNRIAQELSRHLSIRWLPTVSGTEGRKSRDAVGLAILIFFVGATFGAVFKPFFESIAAEAGKDTYSAIKQLMARLWKKEHDRLYASRVGVYIIADCGDNYVVLPVGLPRTLRGSQTLRELEQFVDKNTLLADWRKVPWHEVKAALEKHDRRWKNSSPGSLVHVLWHDGKTWGIESVDSRRFFRHLEIERWPIPIDLGKNLRELPPNTALEPTARKKPRSRRGSARGR